MRSVDEMKKGLTLSARFYKEYIRPRKGAYFTICILHILFAAALVAPPYLLKDIIDVGIGEKDAALVTFLAVMLFVVFAAVAVIDKVRNYWGHIVAQRITYTLRNRLYSHLQKLSFSFYDNIKIGELLSRIIDDLNITQEILYHGPQNIITNGCVLLFTAIMMFALNWKLALICLVVMVIVGVVDFFIARRMFMGARQERRKKASLSSRTEDNLSGIRIIQSFVREHHEMDRFDQENRAHYGSRLQVITAMSWLFPVSILILGFSLALAAGIGGHAVLSGTMTVGVLAAFVMYLQRFMWPMLALAMISEQITRFFAGIERYFKYMDIDPDVKDKPDAVELGKVQGEVCFENVWFRYQNEDILKGINLTINPGETVALVGPSGAGKTTVTSLIPRFYEPYHGRLLVDGYEIRDVKIQSLRDNIGLVMQNDYLFSDSLFNNIAYGKLDATSEQIYEAARQANVDKFANELPEGYDTQIGQRGTKVSEGQAQRISIARALLKDPPILILDEATSSVDSQTEMLIQEALDRLITNKTCILIAHRLSTIVGAKRICFIENGRIVEEGSHRELMAKDGQYAYYYKLQSTPQAAAFEQGT